MSDCRAQLESKQLIERSLRSICDPRYWRCSYLLQKKLIHELSWNIHKATSYCRWVDHKFGERQKREWKGEIRDAKEVRSHLILHNAFLVTMDLASRVFPESALIVISEKEYTIS